uniref:(California timema) hypothetical protein n=1 Tax=Timema californicum TaxID=61474 RepID=A0A7R9JDC4_TIMCA|nr:unnamed protein product [Timema californicum]
MFLAAVESPGPLCTVVVSDRVSRALGKSPTRSPVNLPRYIPPLVHSFPHQGVWQSPHTSHQIKPTDTHKQKIGMECGGVEEECGGVEEEDLWTCWQARDPCQVELGPLEVSSPMNDYDSYIIHHTLTVLLRDNILPIMHPAATPWMKISSFILTPPLPLLADGLHLRGGERGRESRNQVVRLGKFSPQTCPLFTKIINQTPSTQSAYEEPPMMAFFQELALSNKKFV